MFAGSDQGVVLGQRQFTLKRRIDVCQSLVEQALGQGFDLLVAADALVQGHRAGTVNEPPRVALGEANDAP